MTLAGVFSRLQIRLSAHCGSLAPWKVIWSLVILFSAWIILDVMVLGVTGGLAHATFDTMVRHRVFTAAPDPRIVVIDIDESSLLRMSREFGRWPWPRDTLATVLDAVEKEQPAAIVWDIVFSDADTISPGGDAAFDAAVRRSRHSIFPVVRLPAASDASSALTRKVLPGLWTDPDVPNNQPVALIAPVFPSVAAAPLGYNNGYVDDDGVLRHFRPTELLRDGSTIRSVAMAALQMVDPQAYAQALAKRGAAGNDSAPLIAWRETAKAYPHIPFADVFDQADGGQAPRKLPSFAGKVVLIGATAASLHDIHPTPISSVQTGVDSLATVIDNTLNGREIRELPKWLQACLAIGLSVALGLWVQFRKFSELLPLAFVVPGILLLVSYASLNGSPIYVDLHLSAALALLFFSLLRYWNQLRRIYWCSIAVPPGEGFALLSLTHKHVWTEKPLDQLIDLVSHAAPACRVIAVDVNATARHQVRWPELAKFAALVGPLPDVLRVRDSHVRGLARLGAVSGKMRDLRPGSSRMDIGVSAMTLWAEQGREF